MVSQAMQIGIKNLKITAFIILKVEKGTNFSHLNMAEQEHV
jgi:hypothetical protein